MLKGQKWNNRVFNTFLVRDSSSAELMQMDNMVNYKGRPSFSLVYFKRQSFLCIDSPDSTPAESNIVHNKKPCSQLEWISSRPHRGQENKHHNTMDSFSCDLLKNIYLIYCLPGCFTVLCFTLTVKLRVTFPHLDIWCQLQLITAQN